MIPAGFEDIAFGVAEMRKMGYRAVVSTDRIEIWRPNGSRWLTMERVGQPPGNFEKLTQVVQAVFGVPS